MPRLFAPKLGPISKLSGPVRLLRPNVDYTQVIQVVNWGFETQSFQPPHRAPEKGAPAIKGRDGFAVFNQLPYMDQSVQMPQPPKAAPCRQQAAALMRGDDGIEQVQVNFYPSGGEVVAPPQPLRAFPTVRQRYPGTKGSAVFGVFPTFYPVGFEIQPPHFRRIQPKLGTIARGDDGTEAPFIPPSVTVTSGWGFDPTLPLFRRQYLKQNLTGDDGIQSPLVNFYPAGFEIQAPHFRRIPPKLGTIAAKDDGNELPMPQSATVTSGWGFDPSLPELKNFPRTAQRGSAIKGRDGFALFPNFYPFGWEIQSVQPPHRRVERAGAIAIGDSGTENVQPPPVTITSSWGFDPTLPLFRRQYLKQRFIGDDGTENVFIPPVASVTSGWGFDPAQIDLRAFPTVKQRGQGAIGESVFAAFSTQPWTDDLAWQPYRVFRRDPTFFGDTGIEAKFIPSVVTVTSGWGFDLQPYQPQRIQRKGGIVPKEDGIQSPLVQFYPTNWDQLWHLPVPTARQRYAAIWLKSGFAGSLPFYPTGFEAVLHQPQHPRPERFGAIAPWENGTENILSQPVTITSSWGFDPALPELKLWPRPAQRGTAVKGRDGFAIFPNFYPAGWEVAPPHLRPSQPKLGTIARSDDGNELPPPTVTITSSWGFDLQAYQPQHIAYRSGAMARWDDGIEFPKINWFNFGWEIAPHQPQHPRPERFGSIAPWEDGIEGTYTFVPPPVNMSVFRPLMGVGI